MRQTSAPTGKSRSHRWSSGAPCHASRKNAGPPAARAPTAPARYAIALYRPKTRIRTSDGAWPIIACSSDVIGPDSLASVDIMPVSETAIRTTNESVSAKIVPTTPNATRRAA